MSQVFEVKLVLQLKPFLKNNQIVFTIGLLFYFLSIYCQLSQDILTPTFLSVISVSIVTPVRSLPKAEPSWEFWTTDNNLRNTVFVLLLLNIIKKKLKSNYLLSNMINIGHKTKKENIIAGYKHLGNMENRNLSLVCVFMAT